MNARTALVVEDDDATAGFVREVLEQEGFQVVVEKDGDRARESLERRLPDVLVTDVLLPTLGGFELVGALREMPGGREVAVVVMTGIYRGARHKRYADERLGVKAFLDKPFDMSGLKRALERALGHDYPGRDRRKMRAPPTRRVPVSDPLAGPESASERDEVERQARHFRNERTARGNLKHKRFPEVLSQLYRWRATGALLLKRERVKKIVYLKDGYPIFVKSNLLSECLGRVLVRERMITEAECEESLKVMKKRKRQQGTVLIEMGIISPHNLVYALQLQLETKLFDIFGWPDGEYLFNARIDIPPQAVHLDMSLATIVYEGVRRGFQDQQLKDLLAPFEQSYLAVHPDPLHRFQDIALEADERKTVGLVDGRRTMAQIIERSSLGEKHARQLLYALMAAEMIQPQTRRARKKDALEVPPLPSATPPPLRPPPRPSGRKAAESTSEQPISDLLPRRGRLDGLSVRELRARLAERVKELKKQTLFAALGVSRSASDDEIRRAYYAAVRDYHRDRLPGNAPADARALAEQIEAHLTAAYDTLRERASREEYERSLDAASHAAVTEDVGRILAAEGRFQRGSKALEKGDFEAAATLFEEAVQLYPDEGEFLTHLGWASFQRAPENEEAVAEAEARIREGIKKNPRSDRGWLFLGRLLKATERTAEAERQFEQAIQCNPDCKEALHELKLLAERRVHRRSRGGAR